MANINEKFSTFKYVDFYFKSAFAQSEKQKLVNIKIPCFSLLEACTILDQIFNIELKDVEKISVYRIAHQYGTIKVIFRKIQTIDSNELKELIKTYNRKKKYL
jgi:hypothetical protein